jgi:hypothetical protein
MPSDCLETQVWYTKALDVFNILDYEKKPVKDKDWVFNRRANDRGYSVLAGDEREKSKKGRLALASEWRTA